MTVYLVSIIKLRGIAAKKSRNIQSGQLRNEHALLDVKNRHYKAERDSRNAGRLKKLSGVSFYRILGYFVEKIGLSPKERSPPSNLNFQKSSDWRKGYDRGQSPKKKKG